MATALVNCAWDNATPGVGGTLDVDVSVLYVGSDVPDGGLDRDVVRVVGLNVGGRTPAQLQSDIAAQVRARATAIGLAIPANLVLVNGLAKA